MMRKSVPVALALCLVAAPSFAVSVKNNPENKKLPPTANVGYFMGYPNPTYSWHGCTKSATKKTLAPPVTGQPEVFKGNKQKAVEFTVQSTTPYVSWKAKKGWKICGVQAGVVLENPAVNSLLLAEAGYTSGKKRGSTVEAGSETIQVRIPTNGIRAEGYEQFEGKTFSIKSVQHVTVFVKKK